MPSNLDAGISSGGANHHTVVTAAAAFAAAAIAVVLTLVLRAACKLRSTKRAGAGDLIPDGCEKEPVIARSSLLYPSAPKSEYGSF